MAGFAQLQADGTHLLRLLDLLPELQRKREHDGAPGAKRTRPDSGMFPEWAWCWPVNRRIIYNRASCDPDGKPYNLKKAVVYWNPARRAARRRSSAPGSGMCPTVRGHPWRTRRREKTVHHAGRRRGRHLRAGAEGRPLPRALRAGGVPGAGKLLVQADEQSGHQDLQRCRRQGGCAGHLRCAFPASRLPPTGSPSTGRPGS